MNLQTDKELYDFLANAPKEFTENEKIKKFQLKNGDFIHCVLWNMHFYITGTDIVKILVWRFQNAGRQIVSLKKFEEGVFSDLRNLKPGIDATLEGPRSDFLEFLYKNGCIRTQKKQKVFFWYSVPHDALFCDALERDLRRETNLYAYSKYYTKNNYSSMPFSQQNTTFEGWEQSNMNQPMPQGIQPHNMTSQQIVPQGMPPHMIPSQGMVPPHLMQPPMQYMPGQNVPLHVMPDYYMEKPGQLPSEKEFFGQPPNEFKFSEQKQINDNSFPPKHHDFNFTPHFDPNDLEMGPKEFESHFKMFEMNEQHGLEQTNEEFDKKSQMNEQSDDNMNDQHDVQFNGHFNEPMNRQFSTQMNGQIGKQFEEKAEDQMEEHVDPQEFNEEQPNAHVNMQNNPKLNTDGKNFDKNKPGYSQMQYDPNSRQFIPQNYPNRPKYSNTQQMPIHYEQNIYNEQVMMPELDEEYAEHDMIIPNKGGESGQ